MEKREWNWRMQSELCQLYMYLYEYFQHRDEGNRIVMQACLIGARNSIKIVDQLVRKNRPDNIVKMPRRKH